MLNQDTRDPKHYLEVWEEHIGYLGLLPTNQEQHSTVIKMQLELLEIAKGRAETMKKERDEKD